MAPGAPLIGDDAAATPSSPIGDELLSRSARIVAALDAIVGGTSDGEPLRGADLIAVADQIRDLRDALPSPTRSARSPEADPRAPALVR